MTTEELIKAELTAISHVRSRLENAVVNNQISDAYTRMGELLSLFKCLEGDTRKLIEDTYEESSLIIRKKAA